MAELHQTGSLPFVLTSLTDVFFDGASTRRCHVQWLGVVAAVLIRKRSTAVSDLYNSSDRDCTHACGAPDCLMTGFH